MVHFYYYSRKVGVAPEGCGSVLVIICGIGMMEIEMVMRSRSFVWDRYWKICCPSKGRNSLMGFEVCLNWEWGVCCGRENK